jgi:hypothetical protein
MGDIVSDDWADYHFYNTSLWIGEFKLNVTEWASCETPPLFQGIFQVRTKENPDAILWANYNTRLKMWGAPSNSPRGAARFQFVRWGGRDSEWRAKA